MDLAVFNNGKIMKFVLHKSEHRGHDNKVAMESFQSLSYSSYYDPDKMNFGVIR
jgi:hypothetical protein